MSYISQFKDQYQNVEQVGSKQMCKATINNVRVLFSYHTIIAYQTSGGVWYFTDKKYSITTSKQISQFKYKHCCRYEVEPHEAFIDCLESLGVNARIGWNR